MALFKLYKPGDRFNVACWICGDYVETVVTLHGATAFCEVHRKDEFWEQRRAIYWEVCGAWREPMDHFINGLKSRQKNNREAS